ncbi:MAG: hypothetical protein A3I75_04075 [Deltaproteobacteria bacterium RIFCSPLOWO2_02_FULL_50_16]|nr:MAG: hypothetical protein A3I75_04075 [Deltaproteobacteria bacterium RIFCSPLOWO2_02_FULL_50_16]
MRRLFPGLIALTIMSLVLAGCLEGSGDSTGSDEADATISENPIVTGTLALSDGTSSSGYSIVAIDEDSSELIASDAITSDGSVSLEVESGNYSLAVTDNNSQLVGILTQGGETIFTIDSDVDLGALTLDGETNQLTAENSIYVSESSTQALALTAEGEADFPSLTTVGDPQEGVTDIDNVYDDGVSDTDADGVIDLLDIDANDDGIIDSVQATPHCAIHLLDPTESMTEEMVQELGCVVFMNLKLNAEEILNGDGDLFPHTADNVITAEITVPSSLAGMITGVTTLISPLYSNPTITGPAGGFTFTSAYPSGDLWEDHSRELFQATDTSGQEVWTVWINPNEDPLPMQLFVFEIQIGGTIVHAAAFLHFVFTTPPLVVEVESDLGVTTISYPATVGTRSNPIPFQGDMTVRAQRPLYYAGASANEICGMYYRADIGYYDASGNAISDSMNLTTPALDDPFAVLCNTSPAQTIEFTLSEATDLPDTYDGTAVDLYQVDFTYVGEAGDNSADILFFEKQP